MPELGIGLVYWPELAAILEDSGLVSVLEVEPQAFWEKVGEAGSTRYRANEALLHEVAQYPQAKLLHGVGQPVGGTVDDPIDYVEPLKRAIELLDPPWISEHLSFNRTICGGNYQETGFLLPPRQSEAGVNQVVRNIRRFSRLIGRPFAFETGVNYLQRQSNEIEDGAFFGAISAQAECGILMDVHNLWCNEQNGRQSVLKALAQMPLDRVWEMHLAGGMAFQSFWLDAHSDLIPPPVYELAARIIPQLPNLGAIIFEILPQHLPKIGIEGVCRQIAALGELWALKPARAIVAEEYLAEHRLADPIERSDDADSGEVAAWEMSLVAALRGAGIYDSRFYRLHGDPGVAVLRQLIGDARRSNLARSLRYTPTLLLLGLGSSETHALLNAYFAVQAPETFVAIEADRFAGFLRCQPEVLSRVPYLAEILAFEHALVRATIYEISTDLVWSTDPTALFSALDEGRTPSDLPLIQSVMRVIST